MYNFEFTRPSTIDDAVSALKGDEAQALGGGQTLIPTMKQRLAAPATLVSLTAIPEMQGVCRDGDTLSVGGATTHATVAREAADHFPGLAGLAGQIGDPAVRNRGTLGGSLANNDPSACYPAAVLGTGATVVTNSREIAADDFFDGMFSTVLEDGEIIISVNFPIPQASAYAKFVQPASRFALTGAFVAKYADGVRVAITGASGNGVFRWTEAEKALSSDFSADALSGLSVAADDMIGDIHGSPDYRAHLVGVMTRRAVKAAA
ncbi:MAG: xanthine dehydrogenase family protein subunit M [Boseongicola sp.]|nr:xanthine dehydrogenase family protein subunit M [Silicimonas sp.]NNF92482.1 xanthine dehydrogenase family protein subunit M [Boseongicola sp.]